jgi:hypothetical protein
VQEDLPGFGHSATVGWGNVAPNHLLQQTPAAFRFFVLQRLSSGRRC